jgi:predicted PurR-regulated permease PerM
MRRVSNPFQGQGIYWASFLVLACALLWLLSDVLAPFVTGLAIAYLLNPFVTYLSRYMPRAAASLSVLLLFVLVVSAVLIVISPMIGRQAVAFFNDLPSYIERLKEAVNPYLNEAMSRFGQEDIKRIQDSAGEYVGSILKGGREVVTKVWSGGMAVIDMITFMIITPIVAFYCMRDWPVIIQRIDDLFPRSSAKTLRTIFNEFDMRLSGFMRGQVIVCLCLGVFYGTLLTAVGLNFGLAIGTITGILSFIPFVGSTIGFVSSVGVALVQFDDFQMPMVVAGIFFLGQFIEGNFLTPNLVGKRVGLHAVWVIFALMAGGKLLGFTGMLLAVPIGALMGVVVGYAIMWYKQSPFYKDKDPSDAEEKATKKTK